MFSFDPLSTFLFLNQIVEILARNLETESSLHRRVDLFFLVDSITQCSRGLKGDASIVILYTTRKLVK